MCADSEMKGGFSHPDEIAEVKGKKNKVLDLLLSKHPKPKDVNVKELEDYTKTLDLHDENVGFVSCH